MAISFEQAQPMAPGISESAGALSQYEKDRQFAMEQRAAAMREQQQAFQQQLQGAQFQQSQTQPFQLNEQRAQLEQQSKAQELTMHERLRMERLRQQISAVQEQMEPGGRFSGPYEQQGRDMILQIQTNLNPMEYRLQQSNLATQEQVRTQRQTEMAHTDRLENERRQFLATGAVQGLQRVPDPDNPGRFLPGWHQWDARVGGVVPYDPEHYERTNRLTAAQITGLQASAGLHTAQTEQVGQARQPSAADMNAAYANALREYQGHLRELVSERARLTASSPPERLTELNREITQWTAGRDAFFERARQDALRWHGSAGEPPGAAAPQQNWNQLAQGLATWVNSEAGRAAGLTGIANVNRIQTLLRQHGSPERMPAQDRQLFDEAVSQLRQMQSPQPVGGGGGGGDF